NAHRFGDVLQGLLATIDEVCSHLALHVAPGVLGNRDAAGYPGEWEAMPSYIEEPEAAACKWVSIRERNREKFDLPTVFSILIYTHPETGFPLAICDGSYHTVMRTGASAAVSAKWLARKNSKKLAIVGAGHMAEGTPRHLRHG